VQYHEFIAIGRARWERLTYLLDLLDGGSWRQLRRRDLQELGRLYRLAASDLARAAGEFPDPELLNYLNSLVGRAHGKIYQIKGSKVKNIIDFYRRGFPRAVRDSRPFILSALGVFLASALWGFWETVWDPAFAHLLIPPQIINSIEQGQMWTRMIVTVKPLASSFIMTNNISVTLAAMAFGIFWGLGTLYVMLVNGLSLGTVAAYCHLYGMSLDFWSFVVPHGLIELSCIIIAGGAGFDLGWALVAPGEYRRRDALVMAGKKGVKLILGTIPVLVVAGVVEGFVSPLPTLSSAFKLALGVLLFVALMLYLLAGGREKIKEAASRE
jgi:uncharacterized membrane protein SpoIIM required for sporulation